MRNKYKDKCFMCGRDVAAGDGHFQAVGGMNEEQRKKYAGKTWLVRCKDCVGKGNSQSDK